MFSKKNIYLAFFSILFISLSLFFIVRTISPYDESLAPEQTPILDEHEDNESAQVNSDAVLQINPAPVDEIQVQLDNMTVDEKIGQLFILGFEGQTFEQSTQLKDWITSYHIGNFIVFKRNINSESQLTSLISDIDAFANATVPIWMGIDQEGGVVNRLPTKYESAKQFALRDDATQTYNSHSKMANHLTDIGIDINFGPVLDINSNPKNPVINTRAFGTDADTVIRHTETVIRAYGEAKLLAVGKHFPGHGDTTTDSHYELPIITKLWDELAKLELLPFQHAITEHLPSIMVGHLLITDVDDTLPASLSPAIIQDKLIDELEFDGIIITDDLIMEGILAHHTIGEATVKALQAGVHMVIIGHQPGKQLEAVEAVKVAVEADVIPMEQLNQKVYRILKIKHEYEN